MGDEAAVFRTALRLPRSLGKGLEKVPEKLPVSPLLASMPRLAGSDKSSKKDNEEN